jgi:hypothetical protein
MARAPCSRTVKLPADNVAGLSLWPEPSACCRSCSARRLLRRALSIEGTPVFMDVEGMPGRNLYYIVGLRYEINGEQVVPQDKTRQGRIERRTCLSQPVSYNIVKRAVL